MDGDYTVAYGKTTSSEMITGLPVVMPAGVGKLALGIGPGEPPGPAGKPGTNVPDGPDLAGMPPSIVPPWQLLQLSPIPRSPGANDAF